MRKRSIKLLTKTTTIYLLFVVLTFFITARFLIIKSDDYLTDQSERFFQHREHRLLEMINNRKEEDKKEIAEERHEISGLIKFDNANDSLKKLYPIYRDSLIFNQDMGEYHLYKLKTVLLKVDSDVFEYTIRLNIDDFTRFKIGLLKTTKQAFIILALAIVLFSFLLSGLLLTPFHRILQQMNEYKIGKKVDESFVKTSTQEFIKMHHLFKKMVFQTEDDYRKLKEYTENMAHEMQTPLAIIHSKTELLIADDEVMKNYSSTVKVIYDEATHLSNLGNTLNLLTKIENGEYSNVEKLKTFDIITNHIEAVSEMFSLKGLQLEVNLDPNHTINLDPLLFDVMLKNLIKNALRYATIDGPVVITTTGESIIISNHGKPLSFDSSKIFNRFVGSDGAKSSLGLGLALVKKICDLNQLSIHYRFDNERHIFTVSDGIV